MAQQASAKSKNIFPDDEFMLVTHSAPAPRGKRLDRSATVTNRCVGELVTEKKRAKQSLSPLHLLLPLPFLFRLTSSNTHAHMGAHLDAHQRHSLPSLSSSSSTTPSRLSCHGSALLPFPSFHSFRHRPHVTHHQRVVVLILHIEKQKLTSDVRWILVMGILKPISSRKEWSFLFKMACVDGAACTEAVRNVLGRGQEDCPKNDDKEP